MAEDEKTLDFQIQFARHNFENHQALIRFSDTKAAAMMTIYVFLAATGLQVIKDSVIAAHVHPYPTAVVSFFLIGSATGLVMGFVACLLAVQSVLRPRGARYYRDPKPGIEMLWQEHVIAHSNNTVYQQALRIAEPELLLKNLADQVFELAHISKEKMANLESGRQACVFGFWCWMFLMISSTVLLRLK